MLGSLAWLPCVISFTLIPLCVLALCEIFIRLLVIKEHFAYEVLPLQQNGLYHLDQWLQLHEIRLIQLGEIQQVLETLAYPWLFEQFQLYLSAIQVDQMVLQYGACFAYWMQYRVNVIQIVLLSQSLLFLLLLLYESADVGTDLYKVLQTPILGMLCLSLPLLCLLYIIVVVVTIIIMVLRGLSIVILKIKTLSVISFAA